METELLGRCCGWAPCWVSGRPITAGRNLGGTHHPLAALAENAATWVVELPSRMVVKSERSPLLTPPTTWSLLQGPTACNVPT